MAAKLQLVKEDAMKQQLLALAAPQQHRHQAQQQQQERLEQALAEYKELKKGQDPEDSGEGPVCASMA
jgi:hypothetical protein